MINKIEKALHDLRLQKPLILCLTNFVTMEFVANSLLSLGAAPMMSTYEDELEELIQIAHAVYINIGTLDAQFIGAAKKTTALANQYNKPIILDPVGAGATQMRTNIARFIASYATIIRGNASEIIGLECNAQTTQGVESIHTTEETKAYAKFLALKNHTSVSVVVSGPVDFITDGHESSEIPFGSSCMQLITGMGCAMTAVIAAFKATITNHFEASVLGAHYFSLCGEIISKNDFSPGSFKTAFLDQLHTPHFKIMREIYDQKNKLF